MGSRPARPSKFSPRKPRRRPHRDGPIQHDIWQEAKRRYNVHIPHSAGDTKFSAHSSHVPKIATSVLKKLRNNRVERMMLEVSGMNTKQ